MSLQFDFYSRNALAGSFLFVSRAISLEIHDLASDGHSHKLVKMAILNSIERFKFPRSNVLGYHLIST